LKKIRVHIGAQFVTFRLEKELLCDRKLAIAQMKGLRLVAIHLLSDDTPDVLMPSGNPSSEYDVGSWDLEPSHNSFRPMDADDEMVMTFHDPESTAPDWMSSGQF
jgi:hypothetical protein